MVIANVTINFLLPLVSTLKGRRQVVNSIKDRLRKHNLSILDLSGEYPKEGSISIVFGALDDDSALGKIQNVEEFLYKMYPEVDFEVSYELL